MRVMPEAAARVPSAQRAGPARPAGSRLQRARALAARTWSGHRLFILVLIPATLLRADAELGYRWQAYFPDSIGYIGSAVYDRPDATRVSGYAVYLKLLQSFHSLALVTISQHLMGLGIGVMIYALARRHGAPSWLPVLVTLPVLYVGDWSRDVPNRSASVWAKEAVVRGNAS